MYSSPFNLTRMFLNSFVTCFLGLMILFHLSVNCLGVVWIDCLYVCRVCFDCATHRGAQKACTVPPLPPSGPVFPFFFKKNGKKFFSKKKWPDVRPDERLTSGVRRQPHPTWRSDVRRNN
jgi:hypothetical protein